MTDVGSEAASRQPNRGGGGSTGVRSHGLFSTDLFDSDVIGKEKICRPINAEPALP